MLHEAFTKLRLAPALDMLGLTAVLLAVLLAVLGGFLDKEAAGCFLTEDEP